MNIPIPVRSVSCSFIQQVTESTPNANWFSLDEPPNVQLVDFNFNCMNQVVKFGLKDREEILRNYLMSMGSSGRHALSPTPGTQVDSYGVGLNYTSLITNTKLTLNILSDVSGASPYNIYLYFKGVVEL